MLESALLDAIAPLNAADQFIVAYLRFTLLFLGECLTCQSVYASKDLQELHCSDKSQLFHGVHVNISEKESNHLKVFYSMTLELLH